MTTNLDPLVIISRADGYRLTVARSQLTSYYAALGFTEVARVYSDEEADGGAWDAGERYVIVHADGRRHAVTYENFLHRYEDLGFVLVGSEVDGSMPGEVGGGEAPDGAVWFNFVEQSALLAALGVI
jgi:hypothetical protein